MTTRNLHLTICVNTYQEKVMISLKIQVNQCVSTFILFIQQFNLSEHELTQVILRYDFGVNLLVGWFIWGV